MQICNRRHQTEAEPVPRGIAAVFEPVKSSQHVAGFNWLDLAEIAHEVVVDLFDPSAEEKGVQLRLRDNGPGPLTESKTTATADARTIGAFMGVLQNSQGDQRKPGPLTRSSAAQARCRE